MIENKNLIFKVSTSIIKFVLKIVYFGSFLVWKLFFRRIQFWIIISHKQWKTMNARSGLRRIQAEIFPSVARMEKTWVIFWVLDQRTDYVNRSSRRLCQINCRVKDENDKIEASASPTAPINFTHQTVWLTATDSLTRAVENPKA